MQVREAHPYKADDHGADNRDEGPPDMVLTLLLPEPLCFSFITKPTKRCLSFQFIGETAAIIERVAELRLTEAFELGAPRLFHFRLGHPVYSSRDDPDGSVSVKPPRFYGSGKGDAPRTSRHSFDSFSRECWPGRAECPLSPGHTGMSGMARA